MLRLSVILTLCVLSEWAFVRTDAHAQNNISGCRTDRMDALDFTRLDANHITLTGTPERAVQIDCDDAQLFATKVELFQVDGRFIATGSVLFVSGNSRISAERLDFNTKTKTGTFYQASGTTVIRDKAQPTQFGSQEPNAFFWGEEIQKLGPEKYRIEKGGFTACVQPTPRWEVASGSMTVVLDDYALLRNSLFKVKGVPLLYLPIFYYPMEEDDRSTGLLMPIYGNGTLKGQAISVPFFWAIGRSHDATFTYDWFSKAGHGLTGEYRYLLGPGSSGDALFNTLDEPEITAEDANGQAPRAALRSYKVNGSLVQALPGGFRAQASANYFTSLETQQRHQQDVFQATARWRNFEGGISGNWAEYVISARADRRDYFDTNDTMTRTGNQPRINVSRGERPIAGLPIYFGATAEYAGIARSTIADDVTLSDSGLTRFDVSPTVRVPFTRWPFFTINTSMNWRGTYWTESLDPAGTQIEESIGRQYFEFTSRITGPVFNRIFNTPGNGFAEKFKHVVEPTLAVQRRSAVDEFDRIVKLESGDYVQGSFTQYRYALANRLYAKKEVSREILSVTVSQSLLHRRPGGAVRSELPVAVHRECGADQFLTGRGRDAGQPHRADQRRVPHRVGPDGAHAQDAGGQRVDPQRRLAGPLGRLEPAAAHPRAARLQQPGFGDPLSQRRSDHAVALEPARRQLRLQLRLPARFLPPAAHPRLLQRAVLRDRARVPDLQPRRGPRRYRVA